MESKRPKLSFSKDFNNSIIGSQLTSSQKLENELQNISLTCNILNEKKLLQKQPQFLLNKKIQLLDNKVNLLTNELTMIKKQNNKILNQNTLLLEIVKNVYGLTDEYINNLLLDDENILEDKNNFNNKLNTNTKNNDSINNKSETFNYLI